MINPTLASRFFTRYQQTNITPIVNFKNLNSNNVWCSLLCIITIFLFSPAAAAQSEKGDTAVYFYENGQVSSTGPLRNGKPDGYWKSYYRNGQLKTEGNRDNHELDGPWKFYAENGELTAIITYREGKKHGPRKTYSNNILIREEPFVNDKREGVSKYFYDSGELQREVPFVNGVESGEGYEFDLQGMVISILTYKSGVLVKEQKINRRDQMGRKQGTWVEFFKDTRRPRYEGTYTNDLKHGYWKLYQPGGSLIRLEKWVNGVLIEDALETEKLQVKREIDPETGRLKRMGGYRGGQKDGVHREFDDEGNVIGSEIYSRGVLLAKGIIDENGNKQGKWEYYYETGELKAEGEYKDDLKVGLWKYLFIEGHVEQTGRYVAGKPVGTWNWFYENKQLRKEEEYINGLPDGPSIEYSDSGSVIATGDFVDGFKEGKWEYRIGNVKTEGHYLEGERHGKWVSTYVDTDKKQFEGEYINGLENGTHVHYYPNGKPHRRGKYVLGNRDGLWEILMPDGSIALTIEYENGREIKYNGQRISFGKRVDRELEAEELED